MSNVVSDTVVPPADPVAPPNGGASGEPAPAAPTAKAPSAKKEAAIPTYEVAFPPLATAGASGASCAWTNTAGLARIKERVLKFGIKLKILAKNRNFNQK